MAERAKRIREGMKHLFWQAQCPAPTSSRSSRQEVVAPHMQHFAGAGGDVRRGGVSDFITWTCIQYDTPGIFS